ncbi:uncharacterized protein BCR38DRAFT_497386 [Pseudomassariella vexata]|uniref:CCHC-type domain-containing protein n=1 Tax=Pseudomassariella vexata TaxID=1141098 RepID=A0A1Y2DL01_9PEZI|nr:uncharacterized protein BCR38DRAFT_497386 [Pseudomassariella vexata]ORY59943.1 hypothetical protein BCR38DRAFT_497386 [Pseudomassariella vexata]
MAEPRPASPTITADDVGGKLEAHANNAQIVKHVNNVTASIADHLTKQAQSIHSLDQKLESKFNDVNKQLSELMAAIRANNSVPNSHTTTADDEATIDETTAETPHNADVTARQNGIRDAARLAKSGIRPDGTVDAAWKPDRQRPSLKPLHEGPRYSDAERNLDGTINLTRASNTMAYTDDEKRVQDAWPDIMLQAEAEGLGECQEKNKVVLPVHLKLVRADEKVFDKLSEIQLLLRQALVPYRLWGIRVALELNGDFQQVAAWAKSWRPSWVLFIEAIIQVLNKHHVLYNSITSFTSMLPRQDEAMLNFLWRVRDAFYRMPSSQQSSYPIRGVLTDKLKTVTPSVWKDLHKHTNLINTAEIIEEAIYYAELITRTKIEDKVFSTPATTIQLEGTSAPYFNLNISEATTSKPGIAQLQPANAVTGTQTTLTGSAISDPRIDDRTVHLSTESCCATHESQNKCFNCGKVGHWAKDCRSKVSWPGNDKSPGQNVTIKGMMYKETDKFGNKVRRTFDKWKSSKNDKKVYFVEPETGDEDDRSPAERLEDDDIDEELAAIFATIYDED